MKTAIDIKPLPMRATITIDDIRANPGLDARGTVVIDGIVHADVAIGGDAEITMLVSHMIHPGETLVGRVAATADGFDIVQIDGLSLSGPSFDPDQNRTGDPVVDAIIAMNHADMGDPSFMITGFSGLRVIVDVVRSENGAPISGDCFEHVLLDIPLPERGLPADVVARTLWSAHYAEYVANCTLLEASICAETGDAPRRCDRIVKEAIRCRTHLAGLGLVPATTGRSSRIHDARWTGCSVRHGDDRRLEISLVLDA